MNLSLFKNLTNANFSVDSDYCFLNRQSKVTLPNPDLTSLKIIYENNINFLSLLHKALLDCMNDSYHSHCTMRKNVNCHQYNPIMICTHKIRRS